uniref:2-acylglycerol O-acyltransferase 1 n=1 Tax=Nomascus leucogenys TaxID=61853 RepID=G1REY4_NOMLE
VKHICQYICIYFNNRLNTVSQILWWIIWGQGPNSIEITVMLIIHNYWFLYIPYLTWLYFDWHTPDHNYIFGFHPHGIMAVGAFGNFSINYSDFEDLFPGFSSYLHVLPLWFWCPVFREYVMSARLVSVSKKSMSYMVSKEGGGNISVIVLGGAKESLDAHPGKFTLFICHASLVPVFSFGENELFKQIDNPEGSWIRTVQNKLQKIMGFALPLFHARGVFQYNFGLMPYRKAIHTVVGRPIPVHQTLHPTQEQIEELHQTYTEELRKLFEEHKG